MTSQLLTELNYWATREYELKNIPDWGLDEIALAYIKERPGDISDLMLHINDRNEFLHSLKYLLTGQKDKDFAEFGLTFRESFHKEIMNSLEDKYLELLHDAQCQIERKKYGPFYLNNHL